MLLITLLSSSLYFLFTLKCFDHGMAREARVSNAAGHFFPLCVVLEKNEILVMTVFKRDKVLYSTDSFLLNHFSKIHIQQNQQSIPVPSRSTLKDY